jgi:hypothetical protein
VSIRHPYGCCPGPNDFLTPLIDLSPLDPFGPGLGWSPGVILIALLSGLLLLRGRGGT